MKKPARFTLVELLVVIAIIAILMLLLFPSLSSAKRVAKQQHCGSNLKQIGIGQFAYINDWNGWPTPGYIGTAPDHLSWMDMQRQQEYISGSQVFVCPSEPNGKFLFPAIGNSNFTAATYGLNYRTFGATYNHSLYPQQKATKISTFHNDSNLIWIGESVPVCYIEPAYRDCSIFADFRSSGHIYPYDGNAMWYPHYIRHGKNENFLFFDGHVQAITYPEMKDQNYTTPHISGSGDLIR